MRAEFLGRGAIDSSSFYEGEAPEEVRVAMSLLLGDAVFV